MEGSEETGSEQGIDKNTNPSRRVAFSLSTAESARARRAP